MTEQSVDEIMRSVKKVSPTHIHEQTINHLSVSVNFYTIAVPGK